MEKWQRKLPDNASYDAVHKWVQSRLRDIVSCENCGRNNCRLEMANLSGEYHRDLADYAVLCVWCHRSLDDIGGKLSSNADIIRELVPCKYGHEAGIYRNRAITRRGRFTRRCRECQRLASQKWYAKKISKIPS